MVLRRSAWIALVALTSCSLLTPLGGLSGGEDARGDGGGSDAAPITEGGPVDGGGDTLAPAADGAVSCASLSPPAQLCVDFSNELVTSASPTATSFESTHKRNAGVATIDRTTFNSPSASARFVFSTSPADSYLERSFSGALPARVEFSMAMRLDAADDVEIDLMEIRFAGGDAGLFLKRSAGGAMSIRNFAKGLPSRTIPLPGTMPQARFATYAWVVELGAAPTLTMTIDGNRVLTAASLLAFTGAGASYIAGCTDYLTDAATSLWVDDVIVRF